MPHRPTARSVARRPRRSSFQGRTFRIAPALVRSVSCGAVQDAPGRADRFPVANTDPLKPASGTGRADDTSAARTRRRSGPGRPQAKLLLALSPWEILMHTSQPLARAPRVRLDLDLPPGDVPPAEAVYQARVTDAIAHLHANTAIRFIPRTRNLWRRSWWLGSAARTGQSACPAPRLRSAAFSLPSPSAVRGSRSLRPP
jgi:hypothetical protein